ncbi:MULTISPECIES: NAD(P)/FAD-dependent oxidoreductase [Sporosarcina]|uniref:NAD(P)/FAD-dependent oxidoreductase n=1 Tax=Sporosarcina TaxID=1569 RepID=UPI00129BDBFE|nr:MULTISPECIES: FAD-binding oxidoreductase [Sporosarcina]GKV65618.1 putative oxidoreductase YurR [Sporosarcina sp. NCCP-2331]GLB55802.1 putative oxidoreductase YurR [Sporosarcina sp. NCCP-2378]
MKKVIIIGAGIVGISAAYHLAGRDAEVVVIDREEAGQATKAAAGIICPWASQRRNKAWYALASAGAAYYPELIRSLEEAGEKDTGYIQAGALAIHTDIEKLKKKFSLVEERKKTAPEIGEVELLSAEQMKARFPLLSESYQAVWISGAAKVDGEALRNALESAAVRQGVKLVKGSAHPFVQNGRVAGVIVDGELIEGDKFIVAAGAWANEFTEPLGKKLQISGQKAQILHLQADEAETEKWPVIMPPATQYVVPFQNGRFVAGATHEETHNFDIQPTAGGMLEILNQVIPMVPGLCNSEIKEVRVGIRPHTPNFMPVIGALPDFGNIFAANGLGSSGLTVGPLAGKILAQLVLGEDTGWDLESYTLSQIIDDEH